MAKILLVEDDKALAAMTSEWLALHHTVEVAHNGAVGRDLLRVSEYDLVILDWDLPETNGLEVCRQYRAAGGQAPILFLTGKSSLNDKELAFDTGSDDYLTKPFHMQELSARVRALLRRPRAYVSEVLTVRDIELNSAQHLVTKGGVELKLYPKDFALLEFLMRHPNQIFSAENLLNHVWASESAGSADTVRQCLMRLRQKLDEPGSQPLIKNIHGVGYKLEP